MVMRYFNFRFVYSILLLSAALFVSSCDEDDDNGNNVTPPADFAGSYEYESAKFGEDVTITVQGQEMEFSAGQSADDFVENIIESAGPCDDDTELHLRDGGKLFVSCDDDDANAVEYGTWAINGDQSQLTVNFTSGAMPLSLTLENVRLENDDDDGDDIDDFKLYGTITDFPVPIDVSEPLSGSNLQLVTVDIVLDKED